jgi:hypothetical protein
MVTFRGSSKKDILMKIMAAEDSEVIIERSIYTTE